MRLLNFIHLLSWAAVAAAHGNHDHQAPISGPLQNVWYNALPGDGGTQVRKQPTPNVTQLLSGPNFDRRIPFFLGSRRLDVCHTSHASQLQMSSMTLPSLVSIQ